MDEIKKTEDAAPEKPELRDVIATNDWLEDHVPRTVAILRSAVGRVLTPEEYVEAMEELEGYIGVVLDSKEPATGILSDGERHHFFAPGFGARSDADWDEAEALELKRIEERKLLANAQEAKET